MFFIHNAIAHLIDYSVNTTFKCTRKPKIHVTSFIAILALLQWSGTESKISQRYVCIINFISMSPFAQDKTLELHFAPLCLSTIQSTTHFCVMSNYANYA